MMRSTLKHDDYMRERLADVTFAAEYLQAALDEGEPSALLLALRRVAEARGGIARLASATGLAREALYRTLSKAGNPRLSSLAAILDATGLRLAIVPAPLEKRVHHRARQAPGPLKGA
jgi:probable addiction module antidote protein